MSYAFGTLFYFIRQRMRLVLNMSTKEKRDRRNKERIGQESGECGGKY